MAQEPGKIYAAISRRYDIEDECAWMTRKQRRLSGRNRHPSRPSVRPSVSSPRAYHAQVRVGVRNLRFLCSRSPVEIRSRTIAASSATPALTPPFPNDVRWCRLESEDVRDGGSVNLWRPREFTANIVVLYYSLPSPLPPTISPRDIKTSRADNVRNRYRLFH